MESLPLPHRLADGTVVLFVEVPPEHIILFQGVFDLHEGIAAVRTIDKTIPVISLLSTESMVPICLEVLKDTWPLFHWRNPPLEWQRPSTVIDQ
ncbi:MAG: hypothetical protein QY326_03010 [Bdellovibrionota bacterium]|nr:MAG: hypothetical protein QY326_03010 [Bdellovibrionota bacterium]